LLFFVSGTMRVFDTKSAGSLLSCGFELRSTGKLSVVKVDEKGYR